MIKVVCCGCGEQYGAKDDGRDGVVVSHGFCKVCAAVEMAKIDNYQAEVAPRGVVLRRVF